MYLLENENCARRYNSDCFSVIGRGEPKFQLRVKEALLIHSHAQSKSPNSEERVLNVVFHPIRTWLLREATKSYLNVAKTPEVSVIGFVGFTNFSNHVTHVLNLYIANHHFKVVLAEKLDKLQFETHIGFCYK